MTVTPGNAASRAETAASFVRYPMPTSSVSSFEPDGVATLGDRRLRPVRLRSARPHARASRRSRSARRGVLPSRVEAAPRPSARPAPGRRRRSRRDSRDRAARRRPRPRLPREAPQELVLGRGRRVIGRRPPAVLAPVRDVLGERRADEHALQASRSSTRCRSVASPDATPRSAASVPRAGRRAALRRRASPSRGASRASRSRCAA